MTWNYLDVADFLVIAEAVLDLPAEDLAGAARLDLADSALHAPAAESGDVEFYPDLAAKTAVLASRRSLLVSWTGRRCVPGWPTAWSDLDGSWVQV